LLGISLRSGSWCQSFFQSLQGKGFQNRAGIPIRAESRGTLVPIQNAATFVQYYDLASAYEEGPFASVAVVKPGFPSKQYTVAKWAHNERVSQERLGSLDSIETCCPKLHNPCSRNFQTDKKGEQNMVGANPVAEASSPMVLHKAWGIAF